MPLPKQPRLSDNPMLDDDNEDYAEDSGFPTQEDIVGAPGDSAFSEDDEED